MLASISASHAKRMIHRFQQTTSAAALAPRTSIGKTLTPVESLLQMRASAPQKSSLGGAHKLVRRARLADHEILVSLLCLLHVEEVCA